MTIDSHGHHAEHTIGHHPPARPFARLKLLLHPERRDVFAVAIFALAVAILSLATPIAVEALVNTVAFGILMWPVFVIAAVLMTCLGLAAAIRAMQLYVVELLQRRLFVRVVADYAHRMPRLQLASLDRRHGPELVNRFFDVLNVQKSLASLLLDGIAVAITAIVGMIVLGFYHPFLLGFDIILLLLILFALFVLGINGIRSSLHESHAKYDVAAWLEEQLRCLRAFKFNAGPHLALSKADHLTNAYIAARREHFRVVWRQTIFSLCVQVVASTALLGLGGYLVINRQLTLGQLVAAELIVAFIVASVAKLGKYTETFFDLMAGAEKLGLLTDLPLERTGGESLPTHNRGLAVRAQGLVTSRYHPTATQSNWTIEPNERIAILGRPGSGKTTAFQILCGLREPELGRVELDGIDLRSLDLDHLRERIAYVEHQEVFLGTVLENVRVGRSNLTPTDVREALHRVGLLDQVHRLPHGLDETLTPLGSPLSASQSLRLTLARALAGHPRLLILDGVLDALDLRECPDLLPALFDRKAPWTLLIATTDPVLIQMCDRAIDLSHGDLTQMPPTSEHESTP